MDDIIALIRWSLAVRRKCVIRAIPVATLSGPTSGEFLFYYVWKIAWNMMGGRSFPLWHWSRPSSFSLVHFCFLTKFFSGKNYCDEWYEWARQVRRWTIGAAEVFHYFAIKSFRLPAMVSFSFACKFVFYYGFLLCIASVYTIVAPAVVSFWEQYGGFVT